MKMNQPQIAMVIANLPAERHCRIARECATLEQQGYAVTVIAPRGQKGLQVLPGTRGTRLKPYPVVIQGSGVVSFAAEFAWSLLWVTIRLLGEVLRGRAHAVQVCNPPDVYWPLALVLRLLRRPFVFDHYDLCPEVYATRVGGDPRRWVYRTLLVFEWLMLRTATAVIVVNESFRENALRRGVPAHRLTVVRNGPAHSETTAGTVLPAGHADPRHHIVYLGVIGPQDNVAAAVLGAQELACRRGRADWHMTIAGDGEELPSLASLVAERGLADLVDLVGWLDTAEVDTLLRTATVAVQPDAPTRMNQLSTMAKTVEYLARGVPVVAVALRETRRTAGDAARYVPTGTPAELAGAIDTLLEDPPARERMRAVAHQRFADSLSWERQARGYVALWDRLLARRRHGDAGAGDAAGSGVPSLRRKPAGQPPAGGGPEPARTTRSPLRR